MLAAFASLVIKEARNSNEVSKPEADQEEDNESIPSHSKKDAAPEVEAYHTVGHAEAEALYLEPERERELPPADDDHSEIEGKIPYFAPEPPLSQWEWEKDPTF